MGGIFAKLSIPSHLEHCSFSMKRLFSALLACLSLLSGCKSDGYQLIDHVPEEGLVALYPFDGEAINVTSNSLHGVISGSEFAADRFGERRGAITFDGVDDYVDIPEGNAFKIEPPLSISYWIKVEQNETTASIFANSLDSLNNNGIFATFNSNGANPSFSIGDGNRLGRESRRTVHATPPLEVDRWYHIVGVYTTINEIEIYIDGMLVDTFVSGNADSLSTGPGPVTFGRRYGSPGQAPVFFTGALDEFAFYNRALTPQEVQRLFTTGDAR